MNKRQFFGAFVGITATPILAMVPPPTDEIVKQVIEKIPAGPPGPPGEPGLMGRDGLDGRNGRDWIETRFGGLNER